MENISIRWVRSTQSNTPFLHEQITIASPHKTLLSSESVKLWPDWWVQLSGCTEEECQTYQTQYKEVTGGLAHIGKKPKRTTHESILLLEGSPHRLEAWNTHLRENQVKDTLQRAFSSWWNKSQHTKKHWHIHRRLAHADWHFPTGNPILMGIVNVTPDSFSDGGRYFKAIQAITHGMLLVEQGAELLDIGGESTRPGAQEVDAKQEIERILATIQALAAAAEVPLSIDTYKAEVADTMLTAGASIINDISCMRFDPELASVVAKHDAHLIIMHSRHSPKNMQQNPSYENLWDEIIHELHQGVEKAIKAGVSPNKIAIDPGLGFSKRNEDNYRILKELQVLKSFGMPILIGASRKSFIGAVSKMPANKRLEGSLAAAATATQNGAHILRVHEIKETKRFLDVLKATKFGV